MRRFLADLKIPALVGLLSTLPFMLMEYVNRRAFEEDFPWPLFGTMWLLAAGLTFALLPIARDLRAGNCIPLTRLGFWLSVLAALLTAWLGIGILQDQIPCFLGVPNCD